MAVELEFLNAMSQQMDMELQDVLTDVETPTTSDDEDEDPETPLLHPPESARIMELLQNMICATHTSVTANTPYAPLYKQYQYKKNVNKKIKKMTKNARKCKFEVIYNDNLFWLHLERLESTYKNDGGRTFLNYLVALHCYLTNESESESSSDSDNEEEESYAKKLKFEKKSNDETDDDDDDNVAGINEILQNPVHVC